MRKIYTIQEGKYLTDMFARKSFFLRHFTNDKGRIGDNDLYELMRNGINTSFRVGYDSEYNFLNEVLNEGMPISFISTGGEAIKIFIRDIEKPRSKKDGEWEYKFRYSLS